MDRDRSEPTLEDTLQSNSRSSGTQNGKTESESDTDDQEGQGRTKFEEDDFIDSGMRQADAVIGGFVERTDEIKKISEYYIRKVFRFIFRMCRDFVIKIVPLCLMIVYPVFVVLMCSLTLINMPNYFLKILGMSFIILFVLVFFTWVVAQRRSVRGTVSASGAAISESREDDLVNDTDEIEKSMGNKKRSFFQSIIAASRKIERVPRYYLVIVIPSYVLTYLMFAHEEFYIFSNSYFDVARLVVSWLVLDPISSTFEFVQHVLVEARSLLR